MKLYPFYFFALLGLLFFLLARAWKTVKAQFSGLSAADGFMAAGLMVAGAFLRGWGSYHIDLDPYGWEYIRDALHFDFLPFAVHVPGYPMLISLPLGLAHNMAAVSGFIIAFSVLTIGLVYLLTFLITQQRIAAFFAAALLAFSRLFIQYGGQEIPATCSVFFVTAAFLFLVLWIRTGDVDLWMLMAVTLFIAFNIKTENTIFFPALLLCTPYKKKMPVAFLLALTVISLVFWAPFIKNAFVAQLPLWTSQQAQYPSPYSIDNFLRHGRLLLVLQYRMLPLWAVTGFVLLVFFSDRLRHGRLVLGWFAMTLLYFFWYADIFAQWSMLQVLVPVFIMGGCVAAKMLELCFKQQLWRYFVAAVALSLLAANSTRSLAWSKPFSWVDLKRDLPKTAAGDCIVSLNVEPTAFSLRFLFPERHWVFANDPGAASQLSQCPGKIYYFDPIPYGLMEETTQQERAQRDIFIKTEVLVLGNKYAGELVPKH